jgi:hypothetical protein
MMMMTMTMMMMMMMADLLCNDENPSIWKDSELMVLI